MSFKERFLFLGKKNKKIGLTQEMSNTIWELLSLKHIQMERVSQLSFWQIHLI
jgi:hypothetical protein